MNGDESVDPFVLLPRQTRNSRVVRELDPQASRNLWLLLALVAGLVAGLALYAWPRLQSQRLDDRSAQMQRERERLLEENRKLRLERASLENLERIQAIATRDLGLKSPEPDRIYVAVKPVAPPPDGTRLVSAPERAEAPRTN
jgi:cell division protein FtsL